MRMGVEMVESVYPSKPRRRNPQQHHACMDLQSYDGDDDDGELGTEVSGDVVVVVGHLD